MAPEEETQEPIIKPRVLRAVKNRPRALDMGVREEFLDALEKQISERRTPKKISERVSKETAEVANRSVFPVIRTRVESRIEQLNESVLENL